MTTGIHPEATACLADWAARQLELKPDASAPEVRAAFLRRLEGEDFVPPWRWQQAYQLLERRPTDAPKSPQVGQVLQAEEDRLREEVEQFAGSFFDFGPQERQTKWQVLVQQCRFSPPLRSRLRGLEPGLQVDPAVAHDNPRVCQLAEHIRETFALRPTSRAASRQAFLRDKEDHQAWELAARQVRECHPPLAALDPYLVRQLRIRGEEDRKTRGAWARVVPPGRKEDIHQQDRIRRQIRLLVVLILIMVFAVFAGVVSSSSNSNRSTYRPSPTAYDPYNDRDPLKSTDEWKSIHESMRQILLKKDEEEKGKPAKDPDVPEHGHDTTKDDDHDDWYTP